MNDQQKYELEKAKELIEDSLICQNTRSNKILSTWLSVAGDYCRQVAEELKDKP